MISESKYLKTALLASAVLHFSVLGYAHIFGETEVLAPFRCAPREVVTATFAVSEKSESLTPIREDAFVFARQNAAEVAGEMAGEMAEDKPSPKKAAQTPTKRVADPSPKSAPKPSTTPAPEPAEKNAPNPPTPQPEDAPPLTAIVVNAQEKSSERKRILKPSTAGDSPGGNDGPSTSSRATAPAQASNAAGSPDVNNESSSKSARHEFSRPKVDQKKLNKQYGMLLYHQINEVKKYPKFARRAGIEGRVLVAITVDRHGAILAVNIRKSSGHITLDESALATIRDLRRFPLPPSELTWKRKIFELPMRYSLR